MKHLGRYFSVGVIQTKKLQFLRKRCVIYFPKNDRVDQRMTDVGTSLVSKSDRIRKKRAIKLLLNNNMACWALGTRYYLQIHSLMHRQNDNGKFECWIVGYSFGNVDLSYLFEEISVIISPWTYKINSVYVPKMSFIQQNIIISENTKCRQIFSISWCSRCVYVCVCLRIENDFKCDECSTMILFASVKCLKINLIMFYLFDVAVVRLYFWIECNLMNVAASTFCDARHACIRRLPTTDAWLLNSEWNEMEWPSTLCHSYVDIKVFIKIHFIYFCQLSQSLAVSSERFSEMILIPEIIEFNNNWRRLSKYLCHSNGGRSIELLWNFIIHGENCKWNSTKKMTSNTLPASGSSFSDCSVDLSCRSWTVYHADHGLYDCIMRSNDDQQSTMHSDE